VQFEGQRFVTEHHSRVQSSRRVASIVAAAAKSHATVFYTLVGDATRDAIARASARHLVPTVDVLGPSFSALHDLFKRAPRAKPGLLYASNREKFDRQAAIEYTLKHDDGQRPHDLDQADVVLVGVSRVAKSSTCFYLAYEGVKAANVPLLPDVEPPPELLELGADKVIGLRVNIHRLITVREARAPEMGLGGASPYLEKTAIAREVIEANRCMERRGWRSFDASYMAIEEIAKQVLSLRDLRA